MIVCHCRQVTDQTICSVVDTMRQSNPDLEITPGKVYRDLGLTPDCGGCLPLFLAILQTGSNLPCAVPMGIACEHQGELLP